MHFRLAEPKKEVDTLVLDKTPGYEISSFGDLGTTNRNRTFNDVQDTKKGPLKSQSLLSSSVPPGIMDHRGHHMPAEVDVRGGALGDLCCQHAGGTNVRFCHEGTSR